MTVYRVSKGEVCRPTKHMLAVYVARELRQFIEKRCLPKGDGTVSFPYDFNDLVLLSIDFASKGTLQAQIGRVVT